MEVQESTPDGIGSEVMESLGVPSEDASEAHAVGANDEGNAHATLAVQKRLKAQRRAHERETRDLHARIGELESRMTQPNTNMPHNNTVSPYGNPQGSGIDENIHKAVSYALQHKEMEDRKAHEAQQAAHVHRKYQDFQKHLDGMSDKYDDFHDVVFGHDTPFTSSMRDYAMTLPKSGAGSAGEVLYKLGSNRDELQRIAKLHPLDQASELSTLSHALISGGEAKNSIAKQPLGNIKNNPISNSHAITDKTPIGSIRDRMKSGSWK